MYHAYELRSPSCTKQVGFGYKGKVFIQAYLHYLLKGRCKLLKYKTAEESNVLHGERKITLLQNFRKERKTTPLSTRLPTTEPSHHEKSAHPSFPFSQNIHTLSIHPHAGKANHPHISQQSLLLTSRLGVSALALHFQGWRFDSRLRPVCEFCMFSLWFGSFLRVHKFPTLD